MTATREESIKRLKNKIEKNKGSVTNIQSDYASGLVIIKLWYKGKNYAFSYKGKNITEGLSILSWSINRLIDCDLRGILPFERTAKDYLQIASSMKADENFIDADEKYFETLELTHEASNDDVTKNYKKLVKIYHPDNIPIGDEIQKKEFNDKFALIANAFNEIKAKRGF